VSNKFNKNINPKEQFEEIMKTLDGKITTNSKLTPSISKHKIDKRTEHVLNSNRS